MAERDLIKTYHAVFGGAGGDRVLMDLIHKFGFFNSSTIANTPQMTAYQEGQRSVVMAILRNTGVSPELFPDIVSQATTQEYHERSARIRRSDLGDELGGE